MLRSMLRARRLHSDEYSGKRAWLRAAVIRRQWLVSLVVPNRESSGSTLTYGELYRCPIGLGFAVFWAPFIRIRVGPAVSVPYGDMESWPTIDVVPFASSAGPIGCL